MSVTVIVKLSVDLSGDDYSTDEPDVQMVTLANSPAQFWQYALQAGDNYLQLSEVTPPTYLFVDPQAASGATFILRGSTFDVGIPISSSLPSLIPVAQTSPLPSPGTPQYQVVLSSSLTVQTQMGWV